MRESKNYTQCPPVGTTRPKNGLREAEGKITFFSSLSSRYLILFYLCSFSTWPSRLPLFSALCNPVFPRSTELHTAFGCHAALLSRTLRRLLAFLPTSLLPPAKSQITHAEDFYSATAAVIGKWGKNPMVRWNIGEPWRAAVYRVCKKYVYMIPRRRISDIPSLPKRQVPVQKKKSFLSSRWTLHVVSGSFVQHTCILMRQVHYIM